MTNQEYEERKLAMFERAMLFLGTATCKNHGAVPINPYVVRVGQEEGE